MGLSVLWSAFCVACFCSEIRRVRWFRSVHLDEALSSHERKISRMVWTWARRNLNRPRVPNWVCSVLQFPVAIVEGSLEVKLPTIWTDEKQRWEESEKRREEERRSKQRKSQKKEDTGARKGRKVAKHCVFPMICGSGGSKSRLAKAAGAEPSGQMRDERLHAVVARSTFSSQNVHNTPASDRF